MSEGGMGAVYVRVGAKLDSNAAASIKQGIVPAAEKAGEEAGSKIGSGIKKMMVTALAAASGAAVVGFLKDAISEAREAEAVGRQTEAVIKSTGGAAKITADQVGDLATALSNKTAIDDEAIQSASNLLLTFGNVRNEAGKGNDIFNQATATALDLSAALGQDLNSSALMLGKALNDPIAGMTALGRAGVQLTASQKEQIKSMVAMGDTLGAQKLLLAEVTKQVGGSAEALATPAEKAKVAWGNFKEAVGAQLIPVIDKLANVATDKILPAFEKTIPAVTSFFDAFGSVAGAALPVAASLLEVTAEAVTSLIDVLPGGATTVAAFIGVWAGFNKLGGPTKLFTEMGSRIAEMSLQMGASEGAASKAAAGFAGVGKTLGALGVAIPVAAGLWTLIDNAIHMSEQNVNAAADSYANLAQKVQEGGSAAAGASTAMGIMARQQQELAAQGGPVAQIAEDMAKGMDKGAKAAAAQQAAMGPLALSQQALTKAQNDYQLALDQYGSSSPEAAAAAAALSAANAQVESSQNQVNQAMQTGTEALQTYMNQQLAAVNADVAAQQAQIAVTTAQDAYNKSLTDGTLSATQKQQAELTLTSAVTASAAAAAQKAVKEAEAKGVTDTATEANRATLASLQAYAAQAGTNTPAAVQQLIAKLQAQAASSDTAAGAADATTGAVAGTGSQASDTAGKVNGLTGALNSVPKSTKPDVSAIGNYLSAKSDVASLGSSISNLRDKTVTVTTNYVDKYLGGGLVPGNAAGGAIYGPGTGTSDSVLRRLSNGEHVLTAREVQMAGGQSAIYAMRQAIRNGWSVPGYATGGEVGRSAPLPTTANPLTIGGPIYLQIEGFDGTFRASMRGEAAAVVNGYDSAARRTADYGIGA